MRATSSPYKSGEAGGEGATIEYAISALGIPSIVVCGHSQCGAMKGFLHPEAVNEMPLVADWLHRAEEAGRKVSAHSHPHSNDSTDTSLSAAAREEEDLLSYTVEQNVLVQMENLRTYPTVAAALAQNKIQIYGWVYHLGSGEVDAYDPAEARFVSLATLDSQPESNDSLSAL